MIRLCFIAIVLLVVQSTGSLAQSDSNSSLRGSTPVAAPRTLTERRIDRQRGLLNSDDPAASTPTLGPISDPFDDFSIDPATGEQTDRSNVFRDLDDSGDPPVPRARASRTSADGDDTSGLSQANANGAGVNSRSTRVSGNANPEPATGTLNGQPLPGEALSRDPRAPNDQLRTFSDRADADDLFQEQDQLYDPLGLRLGSFVVLPSVILTGGVSDNTSRTSTGKSGSFYRIVPEVIARSDWSRHQLDATFRGSFQGFPSRPEDNDPAANLNVTGRIDVGRATSLDVIGIYDLVRENQSSPNVAIGDTDGVFAHTFSGSVAVNRSVGLVGLSLGGSATRELFKSENTGISLDRNGAIITGSDDRTNTEVLATLRLSLENESSIRPYVEASGGRREFDGDGDALGFNRDSTIAELRGGTVIDMTPKLGGELNVGYRNENVNDGNLEDLRGLVFDASLTWSPDRLTLITLNGATDFRPTTIAGATGSIVYSGTLALRRSLQQNLTLDAGIGLSFERFQGFPQEDVRTNGNLGLTWDLSRNAALTGQYSYERLDSTSRLSDYDAHSVEFGIRLQR